MKKSECANVVTHRFRIMSKDLTKQIERVVVNIGVGKKRDQQGFDEKILPEISKELALITGQRPSYRPARKSIAGFKIREGDVVGLKVTLRGQRMADFLTRVINVALPRVRDFRGIDLSNIDEMGNLNFGFRDQTVFPEVDMDTSNVSFGFQVTVVPKKRNRENAIDLYRTIGVPLKQHG